MDHCPHWATCDVQKSHLPSRSEWHFQIADIQRFQVDPKTPVEKAWLLRVPRGSDIEACCTECEIGNKKYQPTRPTHRFNQTRKGTSLWAIWVWFQAQARWLINVAYRLLRSSEVKRSIVSSIHPRPYAIRGAMDTKRSNSNAACTTAIDCNGVGRIQESICTMWRGKGIILMG